MKKLLSAFAAGLLATVALLFTTIESRASHIYGMDLNYQWMHDSTYQISVIVYGDCSAAARRSFDSLPTSTPIVCIYNGSTYVTSVTLTEVAAASGINVTPVCPTDLDSTQCTNTAYTLTGIEKFTYTGTYTFMSRAQYWRIVYNGSMGTFAGAVAAGRTASITNIETPGSTEIYLVDTLNNLAGEHNTSPRLPGLPSPYYYFNFPNSYNPAPVDTDGDALTFFLVAPQKSSGTGSCPGGTGGLSGGSVTYVTGFSATSPVTTGSTGYFNFYSNGQIDFEPTIAERDDIVYNVEEMRGGVLVGTSQREMTFQIISDPGSPPVSSTSTTVAVDGTIVDSTDFSTCVNSGTCSFTFHPVATDTTWDVGIANGPLPSWCTLSITRNDSTNPTVVITGNTSGVTPGVYSIFFEFTDNGCPIGQSRSVTYTITVLPQPLVSTITGTDSVCAGSTVTLIDTATSGTWSSSNTGVATVSAGGVVTGVTVGSAIITYYETNSCGADSAMLPITVKPGTYPGSIVGSTNVCVGTSSSFSDSVSGGTWSVTSTALATINSSGLLTGVADGSDSIKYTVAGYCGTVYAAKEITITSTPTAGSITGATTICVGTGVTLTDGTSGGTWSHTNSSADNLSGTSTFTGVAAGVDTVKYTVVTSCGTAIATHIDTVLALANAGTISGATVVCQSATITLVTTGSAGTWTSDSTRLATIGAATGIVTGQAGGVDTIKYTVNNSCGTSVASYVITINPLPVPDAISGAASLCPGDTSTFTDPSSGGSWSTTNASVATVNSSTGLVTGVSVGTVDISYSITNTCGTVATGEALAVNATPSAGTISGPTSVCPAATISLADVVTGGTWTSSNNSIATVNSSGVVTGVAAGTDTIKYAVVQTCGAASTTYIISVTPIPTAGTIIGADSACVDGASSLSDATTGGVWSSVFSAIASVSPSGMVTGVVSGIDTIKYTVTNACGTAVTKVPFKVNPLPTAGVISGTPAVCIGSTATLTESIPGGTWSSANAARATITAGGVLNGVSVGTVLISYAVTNTCGTAYDTVTVTVNPLATVSPITGTLTKCQSLNSTLADATSGGVWSSSNTDVAVISSGGIVTADGAGTSLISYSVTNVCNTAVDTATFTTLPSPNPGSITGTPTVCPGTTATVADVVTGGTWSSANTSIATINTSGVITGVSTGVDTIYYTYTNSCGTASTSILATVNPVPVGGSITGSDTVCQASTISLASTGTPGGTWSSNNTAVATVNASGVVTGVSAGNATISYNVTNSCGTVATTKIITVNPLPNAGTITGASSLCPTYTTTLSDAISGGTWSSTNTGVATITSGGFLTAITTGTTTISYAITNSCGTAAATLVFNVTSTVNAGVITGSNTVCAGSSITLSDTVSGGTWSASNTNATINASTGLLGGLTDGADTITYTVTTACASASVTYIVTVGAPSSAGTITGPTGVCVGSTISLVDGTTGGSWSSHSSLIATVNSSGTVGGVSAGTTTITYTLTTSCGSSVTTASVTVTPVPSAGTITGGSSVCVGSNLTLADATTGGTWSISNSNASLAGTVVTGVAAGLDTVSYSVTNACTTTVATQVITVNPTTTAGAISGVTSLCQGGTTTLTETVSGGTWSTSNAAIASINSSGLVTAISGGSVTITYTVTTVCGTATNIFPMTINPTPVAGSITGAAPLCIGSNLTLVDAASGGVWSSGSPTVATVNSSGMVTGLLAGSSVIAYTVTNSCGTAVATATINVFVAPAGGSISGSTVFCVGSSSPLTETVAGGVWSSVTTSVATVNASGTVFGVSAGTSLISYTVTTGCGTAFDTVSVTVNSVATGGTISGPSVVCIGNTINLIDPVSSGTWTSGTPAVATITAGGMVTGVAAGTTIITYTVSSSCGTASATYTVNVSAAPSAGSIGGSTTVCVGATTNLTDGAGGGTWSTTNAAVASVNSSGVVTGVTAGSATISYTVSTSCATVAATAAVTVNAMPSAGSIAGSANVCVGSSIGLTDGTSGGSWSSSNVAVATVDASGNVWGVTAGAVTITYTVSNTCGSATATHSVTVSAHSVPGTISGSTTLCVGATSSLSETSSGGVWTTTNAAVASVNSSGLVTAVSAGSATISYTVTTLCDVQAATAVITVNPIPNAGSITGSAIMCTGTTDNFTDAAGGGTWSSVTTSVATVSAGGLVTAVSNGTSVISYTVTNSCGTAAATLTVTVSSSASAGTLSGASSICTGSSSSYSSTVTGGTWTTSNAAIASINSGGLATGVTTGSVTFTYSVSSACGSATATYAVSVLVAPSAGSITGSSPLCAGTATSFTDAAGGGTWSSSNAAVATVGSSSGSVNAVSPGSVTISYTVTNACGSANATLNITVDPLASGGVISGTTTLCAGTTSPLSETVSGGTWSSSNPGVASISATGLLSGVTAGTATISYSISGACGSAFATTTATVNAAPNAGTISGPTGVCVGSSVSLSETSGTGTWSSSNSSIASVNSSGNVTGVALGSATISYTATNSCGTAFATASMSVANPAVAGTISGGGGAICQASTTTLTESSSGGTWISSNSAVATVSAGGVVTGTGAGLDTITYQVVTGCSTASTSTTIAVNPLPAPGTLVGSALLCTGATETITGAGSGGTWSSTNSSVASVNSSGVVTGISSGSATISYSVTNSCGTAASTLAVTVSPMPSAGSITGSPNVCIGSTATLSDAASGGTWSSSNSSVVSVSSSGVITGVSNGSAIISYTVAASCSTAVAIITANSNPFPDAGTITGPTNICIGSATTYVDTTSGGVWSSGSTAIATVNTSGVVTGVSVGAVNIYYSVTNACGATNVTISIHVLAGSTIGAITGTAIVCPGATSTLSDTTSGGAWSSSDTTIARVSSTGIVTGVAGGTATISYGVTSSCGTAYVTTSFTVRPATNPGTISGTTAFCPGATSTFTPTISGGTWSSSNTSVATVNTSGVVTGVSAGTAIISYTVSGVCGAASATATVVIAGGTGAGAITGPSSICVGLTAGLGDTVSGGTWSSSNTSIATISSSGLVGGVAAGSATISYTVSGSCGTEVVTHAISVTTTPYEGLITGSTSVCAGATTSLTESISGGTWSSGTPSIATVNTSGVVTGVSGGTVIISYSITDACGMAVATAFMTVRPLPATGTITGTTTICMGSSSTLADTAGSGSGTWSSSNTAIATVSASGVVTPVSIGSATISYSLTNACGTASATTGVTIMDVPSTAGRISGALGICPGSTLSLTETISGGTWSSSNTAIASVSPSGVVTAISGGVVTIVYTVTNSCGSAEASILDTVYSGASAGTISASTTNVCIGYTISLSDAVSGGTWHSGSPSIATVDASGNVTGLDSGSAVISYTVTGACGTGSATVMVNVSPIPSLGTISGPTSLCTGTTASLSDRVFGGAWSSSNTSVATISTSGSLTGVAAGITTISYSVTNSFGCTASIASVDTVNPAPAAGSISGTTTTVCAGTTIGFTDAATGGAWSSSNTSVATVSSAGVVGGVASGSATISYSVTNSCGTATAMVSINVNPAPALSTIGGSSSMCSGTTATLTNSVFGGTWSSSNTSVATISSSGVVTAVGLGITTISYADTNGFGCGSIITMMDTVSAAASAGVITSGSTTICTTHSVALSDTAVGGVWSISDATIATISTSGLVTGLVSGTATATYSVTTSGGCTAFTSVEVNVDPSPVVGPVSGTTSMCIGSSVTLTDTSTGGTWSSSNTSVATIDASGMVTSVGAGVTTISYTEINIYGCVTAMTLNDTVGSTPSVGTISGHTEICSGGLDTLADGTSGGTWSSSNTSIATVSASGVVTGVSIGAVTISYSVGPAGCSATATYVDTVVTSPTVAGITGTTSACAGQSSTLTDGTSSGIWSSTNSSIATVDASGNVNAVSAGMDTILYRVTSAGGCSSTAMTAFTVNANPSAGGISGTGDACLGVAVTLTESDTTGTWSSSNTSIVTVDGSGNVTGVSLGSATITYTVTSSAGCTAFTTMPETVHSLPVVGAITGTTTICAGLSSTLADTSIGGRWSSSDSLIAGVGSSTGIASGVAAGSATITYTVMNSFGCPADATTSVTVTAGGAIGAISGTSSFCIGTSVTLSDGSTGGTWSTGDPAIATVSGSGVVTGLSGGVAIITYTISTGAGCPGVAMFADTVKSVPGTLSPSGSTTLCHGAVVTLDVTSSTATTYQWYNSGSLITGATNATYIANVAGTYAVMVSDGTCSDMISSVVVANPVTPVIHHTTGNILYTGTYTTYQWYRDGGIIAGATNSSYSYSLTGNYIVVVTDASGCTDTSAVYTVTSTHVGVATVNAVDISMYPNPATSSIQITAPLKVNVTILSPDGKVVIEQKDATTVDVSNLANGLYIIMMYDEYGNLLKADKFIKAN